PVLYISSTPLICSPFPYTTLFRSLTKLFQRLLCRSRFLQVPPRGAIKSRYLLMIEQMPNKQASPKTFWSQQYGKFPYPNLAPPKDRKSTRLNSSHVKISYAVFCLK